MSGIIGHHEGITVHEERPPGRRSADKKSNRDIDKSHMANFIFILAEITELRKAYQAIAAELKIKNKGM